MWIRGHLDDALRPDLAGFVLDLDRETTTLKIFHCAAETWPGAFKEEKVMYRLRKLCKFLDQPIILQNHSLLIPAAKWQRTMDQVFGRHVKTTICS